MSIALANSKQTAITGGSVNYYLIIIPGKNGEPDTVVEVEDIIEALDMLFSSGTVFKSIVRLCKLRLDLGKPGSTEKYEGDKCVYYSDRTLAISYRRAKKFKFWHHAFRWIDYLRLRGALKNVGEIVIDVPDPKRLDPYSFKIKDLMAALSNFYNDQSLIEAALVTSYIRKKSWVPHPKELDWARLGQESAELVKLSIADKESVSNPI